MELKGNSRDWSLVLSLLWRSQCWKSESQSHKTVDINQTACSSALGRIILSKGTERINHMWSPLWFCFGVVWIWYIWVFLFHLVFYFVFVFLRECLPRISFGWPWTCRSFASAKWTMDYKRMQHPFKNVKTIFRSPGPNAELSHRPQFCLHSARRQRRLQDGCLPAYCHCTAGPCKWEILLPRWQCPGA